MTASTATQRVSVLSVEAPVVGDGVAVVDGTAGFGLDARVGHREPGLVEVGAVADEVADELVSSCSCHPAGSASASVASECWITVFW